MVTTPYIINEIYDIIQKVIEHIRLAGDFDLFDDRFFTSVNGVRAGIGSPVGARGHLDRAV